MKRNHTVSLCMIVKNEGRYLRRCLSSVSDIVDEIVIVDTGSSDDTVQIAKEFGAVLGYFEWNQNFSDARNQALALATKEWILVLDADEYLRLEDRDKLIKAFNDFNYDGYIIKTLNFNGDDNNQAFITNLNQRIFKNNKNYTYKGAIHEQVICLNPDKQKNEFKIIDVGFYHSGYLATIVQGKNKPNRNLEILKEVAKEDPSNTFTLFNLANEYSQLNDLEEAFRLYDEAYKKESFTVGFMPKLVIFRLQCLINMNRTEEALQAIEEGLKAYPDYTELVYYRALLEKKLGQITKTIQSYKKCLEMGKPRDEIEFQQICYDFGPTFGLAEIYEEQQDYARAIEYYNKCLMLDSSKFQLLYPIFRCLDGLKISKFDRVQLLAKYFNLTLTLNQIVFIDILVTGACYEEAKEFLIQCTELNTNSQLIFLHARVEFYLKNYREAEKLFLQYSKSTDLADVEAYLYSIHLITNEKSNVKWSEFYENLESHLVEGQDLHFENQNQAIVQSCLLMRELYLCKELTWFEKIAQLASEFVTSDTTLQLAGLLLEAKYHQLAEQIIVKSIKASGKCSREEALLLTKILQ